MTGSGLVDAHCHFDLFPKPREVLQEAEQNQIFSIAVTNTPSVFKPMVHLAKGLKFIRPALGLHPELAIQRVAELPLFGRLVRETKYVGEVGLDYKVVVRSAERVKQRAIFATILRHCAEEGGRVLTIHSRRAEADVVAAVKEHRPGPFILHWYSGSLKNLWSAVDIGAFFSINLAMTRSERGRRLVSEIPRDRVLTESDGPFVSLGEERASPSSVRQVVGALGQLWGVSAREAQDSVLRNLQSVLYKVGEG